MYTVATMIEACLNSRPLGSISSDEQDIASLTPGHFLIGAALKSPAEPFDFDQETISFRSRWLYLVSMRNHLWKRWSKEFLSHLQQRSKWLRPNSQFKVGDLVLFKDKSLPPTKWPLARIIRLLPGSDGHCRVVDLKTPTSELRRSVNQLILLPVNQAAIDHLSA